MIFLSQFLNCEMSSILIMIVEGFFKPQRSGMLENSGEAAHKDGKEVKICACLTLEKERGGG